MNTILKTSEDLISKYGTSNVRELADILNIDLNHKNFKNKRTESCLIKNYNNHFSIFLKNGLDYRYENFLIAHEIGHFVLHHDESISFYFLKGMYKGRLEREANKFACCLLFSDLNKEDLQDIENFDFIVKEKGIPLEIWYSLNNF